MEKVLWYLFAGTRGGKNRARIVRSLSERPKNANQLADELDLAYNTIRHHLDMLLEHDVIEQGDNDYGALYFPTDQFKHHQEEFETIIDSVEE
jgi:DNA-binding transcriptional ArsR family regulator